MLFTHISTSTIETGASGLGFRAHVPQMKKQQRGLPPSISSSNNPINTKYAATTTYLLIN